MKCFPFMKQIAGARCLLVGGGAVALRKAQTLHAFGARLFVCARQTDAALLPLAEEVYPAYGAQRLDGMDLAVAATDDGALNACVAADSRARGIPVNCVDDPANCDFFFPALITAGDVSIGISTGGTAPMLAAALREYIEARLPADLEGIARRAQKLRGTLPPGEYAAQVRRMLEEGV